MCTPYEREIERLQTLSEVETGEDSDLDKKDNGSGDFLE